MRLKIKINDGNTIVPSNNSSDVKITPQDLLFNVNIKIPDYMQKDFLASIFYNSNNLDKKNYAFQKLIVENDSAFWRSSVVNECEFDLSEKKLKCQFIDSTEMEWEMPKFCEIKLNTIITKLKRGKRKINLEKKKLIEKEEEKKNSIKESQQNILEIQKSKKVFSNLALSFFPFANSNNNHNKLNKENDNNSNQKNTINDNDNIVKNNIKEMILRKMYEYLKSKLKSELIDIYTHFIQHDHLDYVLPQNYYIWLTNSYLHRYEQHILETESTMKVQIYGMEVLNGALKKMRQQFITRFIEINHDKELYESLEVRLQDINSLIIDKKTKTINHDTSRKLGILKFFKRSGQKHKEESKEIREVKRLKTEMKQIQFMMSSLKLATDPSKHIIESKAIIRDQSILPILDDSNASFDKITVQTDSTVIIENEAHFDNIKDEKLENIQSKRQRALKYKDIDELCYKLMMNDFNLDEEAILKYSAMKEQFNENSNIDLFTSYEETTLLGEQCSNVDTDILNTNSMNDKKKKYLDYRKMISNIPQPKFILLHFLYPPFLDNMKKGILNDINELKDELLDLLSRQFSDPSKVFGTTEETTFEIMKMIEQNGFIDYLFKQIRSSQITEIPPSNDTVMVDADETINPSKQPTLEVTKDNISLTPSLELPMQAPLISSINDQLMMSEKLLPAKPTLLSTVSSFIINAETTAEETLTQISNNHHNSTLTNNVVVHNSTKINTVETLKPYDNGFNKSNEVVSNQDPLSNNNSVNSNISELNENFNEKNSKKNIMEEDVNYSNSTTIKSNNDLTSKKDENTNSIVDSNEKNYDQIYNDLDSGIKMVIDDILNSLKQKYKIYNETYATIVTVQKKNKELLKEINQSTTLNSMDNKEKILNKLLTPISSSNVHKTSLSPTSTVSLGSKSDVSNLPSPTQIMEKENMEELDKNKKQESTLSRLITTSSTLLNSPQNSASDSFEILSNRIGNMSNEINRKMEYDYKQQKFSSYMLFSSYEEMKHITKEVFNNLTSEKNKEFSITDFEFTSSYLHLVATLNVIRYQVEDLFHKNINLMLEHENWRNERNKILSSIQERSLQENDAIQERRKRNNRIQTYLFKQYQLRQQYYAQQLKNKQEYYDKQQLYLLKKNKQLEMLKKSENKQEENSVKNENDKDESESTEMVNEYETEENSSSMPNSSPQTELLIKHQESKEIETAESQEEPVQSEFDRIFGDDSFEEDEEIIEDILESKNMTKDENKTTEIKDKSLLNSSLTTNNTTTSNNKDNSISTSDESILPTTTILSETKCENQNDEKDDSTSTANTPLFGNNNKRIPIIYSRNNHFVSSSNNSDLPRIPKRVKQLSLNLESRIVKETYFQQEEKNLSLSKMSSSLDRRSFFDRDYSIFRQRLMEHSKNKDSNMTFENSYESNINQSNIKSNAQDIPVTGGISFNMNVNDPNNSIQYSSSLNTPHNEQETNVRKLRRLSWHGGVTDQSPFTPKSTFEFNQNIKRINEMNNYLSERFTSVLLKRDSIESMVKRLEDDKEINKEDTANNNDPIPKVAEPTSIPITSTTVSTTVPTKIKNNDIEENIPKETKNQRDTSSSINAMDIDEEQTPKERSPLKFKYSFTNYSLESLNNSIFSPSTPSTPSFDNFGYTYQKNNGGNHITNSPSTTYTINSRNYKKKQENTKKILRYRKSKKNRM
ncbi:hypothetical protein BCR36DRAFT_579331 [Piromyces finnis]|uniref:Uncharacterized protein n=1 Tax=Piromyces finnis TaxID=1754191 RepID=A0A1Y1VLS7_9FUNG|nr:hypothetical protein BCR36DRAFT_579331 [Piromyces finnis]|eukprot:ORX59884.1 hypothetical protein BCR36DRAFT_579331 [Piromyces finnis]